VLNNEHTLHLCKRHPCTWPVWRLTEWGERVAAWRDLRGLLYSHSGTVCVCVLIQLYWVVTEFQPSVIILKRVALEYSETVQQCVCWGAACTLQTPHSQLGDLQSGASRKAISLNSLNWNQWHWCCSQSSFTELQCARVFISNLDKSSEVARAVMFWFGAWNEVFVRRTFVTVLRRLRLLIPC
jgi:hypothetical protein